MLEKIKANLNTLILIGFIISVIFCIISVFIDFINTSSGNKYTNITSQNVNIYINDKSEVKDYSTFFNAEHIVQDIIANLNEGKYDEIYSILTPDLKKKISKDQFMSKIGDYVNKNFKYATSEFDETSGYDNTKNLKHLYLIENGSCIAVVTSDNEAKETMIGIVLVNNSNYQISYLDL